jgi:hypothetical protein
MGATAVPSAGGRPIIPTSHGEAGGRLAGVRSVARQDDVARHHGAVFRLQESVFAPLDELLIFVRPGAFHPTSFRSTYLLRRRGVVSCAPRACQRRGPAPWHTVCLL